MPADFRAAMQEHVEARFGTSDGLDDGRPSVAEADAFTVESRLRCVDRHAEAWPNLVAQRACAAARPAVRGARVGDGLIRSV
jgi:hypothetical protein